MEAYFPIISKPSRDLKKAFSKSSVNRSKVTSIQYSQTTQQLPSRNITSGILKTLSDPSNPITHSDIYQRTDHIVSCSTGHQVSSSRGQDANDPRRTDRSAKLHAQQQGAKKSPSTGILNGTVIYIDGYLESTTDIEMKRLIIQAGGGITLSPNSRCTHIVTSRGLSGSKTHNVMTRKTQGPYVVKPEWVLDSIAIGKRRSERSYSIIKRANTLKNFIEGSK